VKLMMTSMRRVRQPLQHRFELVQGMGDDKLNQTFGEVCARFTRDLLFDNEGVFGVQAGALG
jgi:hypothetical protein